MVLPLAKLVRLHDDAEHTDSEDEHDGIHEPKPPPRKKSLLRRMLDRRREGSRKQASVSQEYEDHRINDPNNEYTVSRNATIRHCIIELMFNSTALPQSVLYNDYTAHRTLTDLNIWNQNPRLHHVISL